MAMMKETTGTLSNGAETLVAADRAGLIVGNTSDAVMTVRPGGVATAAIGIPVPAGTALFLSGRDAPDGLVTIFCAGASKTYTAYEW